MATEILMPALSPTMEEGTLAKWLVKEGDEVSSGDILAEIETDKATMEFEAVDEGTIGKILIEEGTEGVKVNTPIAVLLEEGEDASDIENATSPAAASGDDTTEEDDKKDDKSEEKAPAKAAAPAALGASRARGAKHGHRRLQVCLVIQFPWGARLRALRRRLRRLQVCLGARLRAPRRRLGRRGLVSGLSAPDRAAEVLVHYFLHAGGDPHPLLRLRLRCVLAVVELVRPEFPRPLLRGSPGGSRGSVSRAGDVLLHGSAAVLGFAKGGPGTLQLGTSTAPRYGDMICVPRRPCALLPGTLAKNFRLPGPRAKINMGAPKSCPLRQKASTGVPFGPP